ncbi:hypothetical protein [Oryza sativa Japonica Group]|uniref:Uncharacterized protein n=1 Tax=Oryza sativa subsp. japonica TaxID=39947 RepID=Q5NAK6_ORYSJ|nr:hypothetical protein [Oryza sativa Japonica Group]BAD81500.1 hypothetical protein [Oryza sativa Japonica Group]
MLSENNWISTRAVNEPSSSELVCPSSSRAYCTFKLLGKLGSSSFELELGYRARS